MALRAVLDQAHRYQPPVMPPYEWAGVFENWSRGWVHRNFWRVREYFGDRDDALQECALIFVRCCKSYKGPPNQPKLMMAYFKLAVSNDWNTFSVRDGRQREIPIPDEAEQLDFSQGPLAAALSRGSDDLKQFLRVIETAPADFLAILFRDDNLVALNRRIKRLCGIKQSSADIIGELRSLLE